MTKQELTKQDQSAWLHYTMDVVAEDLFGEFGYDTCSHDEKREILKEIIERGWVTLT